MQNSKLILSQLEDDKDYFVTDTLLGSKLAPAKLLTIKKSGHFFIFTYYTSTKKEADHMLSKYEIAYDKHLFANYKKVMDNPAFLSATDIYAISFKDFAVQINSLIHYYHNFVGTVKPAGIRKLD